MSNFGYKVKNNTALRLLRIAFWTLLFRSPYDRMEKRTLMESLVCVYLSRLICSESHEPTQLKFDAHDKCFE